MIKIDKEQTTMTFDQDDVIITDPCYFIPNKLWSNIVDLMFEDKENPIDRGTLYINNLPILFNATAYGDGCYSVYRVNEGRIGSAGVDAGMLCIAKQYVIEAIMEMDNKDSYPTHMFVPSDKLSGDVTVADNGNFYGQIEIKTN
jgi:hypothetical protein